MSAAQARSLGTLVGVRRREGRRLAAALAEARAALESRQDDLRAAVAAQARQVQEETAACAERDALVGAAFTLAALRALALRIDSLKAGTAQAQREVDQARQAVARHAAVVGAAQATLRRNERRVSFFEERIRALAGEREARVELEAEEAAEEGAAARFIGRVRAAREAGHG